MTVTALDPNTALVVVDLQKGIAGFPAAHPFADVVKNAAALADAFRRRDLPVVLVNVAGQPQARTDVARHSGPFPAEALEFLPELGRQPQDHVVTKNTWGAFTNTGLEDHLKGRGVTQVVLCGVATSIGVESTARQAHERGFNVALAVDAMTDRSPEAHDGSVSRIFPRLGETGTTQAIIALLDRQDAAR